MEQHYILLVRNTDDGRGCVGGFIYRHSNEPKEILGDKLCATEHEAILEAADMVRAHVDRTWTAYGERLRKMVI